MTLATCGLKMIKRGMNKMKPIIKFRRLAITIDTGMSSRGNTLCFIIGRLSLRQVTASCREVVRKDQGISPQRTKSVKFFISILRTSVKTKFILKASKAGVINVHQRPSFNPAKLILNCRTDISHKACLKRYIFLSFCFIISQNKSAAFLPSSITSSIDI